MRSILLIIFYVFFASLAFAQYGVYEVTVENQPLLNVLKKVESKYGIFFSYKIKDVKSTHVNISTKATSVNNLLQQLLAHTNLQFEIVDDNFVIIKQKQVPAINTICGTIYDYQSKNPLPYANVLIENTTTGTTTDEDGHFELNYQSTGNEKLFISYVGYEAQSIEPSKFKNKNCPAIMMRMPDFKKAFLVITDYLTEGISIESNGASTSIKPKLVGNIPGTIDPDVLSIVQFLPGVAAPSSRVSDIYIRGCTPDQNLIIWEDIPVYHTAHYFGMISAINPYIIENTNVYRGGFNATYGGRIGGVIELLSPDEKAYKNNLGIGANMTHAQTYAHKKFKLANKPASITFSLRRSYHEIFETPTFKTYAELSQQGLIFNSRQMMDPNNSSNPIILNDFYFIDANAKFSTQINAKNKLQISGMYTINSFNDDIRKIMSQNDSLYFANQGLSLKWQHQWNNKATTVVKAIVANDSLNYNHQVYERDKSFVKNFKENNITDQQLVLHNSFDGSKGQNWQIGYHFTNYKVAYKIFNDEDRKGNFNEAFSGNADLHAFYTHYQNPIENKIGIQAGLRVSHNNIDTDPKNNKVLIEPRFRLDYKLSKSLSLHTSFGMYHQVLTQVEQFKGEKQGFTLPVWELANKHLSVQRSKMFQAGLIYQANNWVIDLQAYQRIVEGISSRAYSEEMPPDRPQNGKSNIKGIDLLIKKRIGKFRSWLSYSISKADITFKINGDNMTFPSNYDQRHILDWSNQLRLNNWHFSAGFKLCSGLPYTQSNAQLNEQNENGQPQPNSRPDYDDNINNHNLPAYSNVNISVNYHLKPLNQKWNAHFTAAIINLLNSDNIYERSYSVINEGTKPKPIDKRNLPFTPNISLRFEW